VPAQPGEIIVIMGSDVISLLAIQIAKLYSPAAIVLWPSSGAPGSSPGARRNPTLQPVVKI